MNRRTFIGRFAGKEDGAIATGQSEIDSSPLTPYIPSGGDGWDYLKAAHLLRRAMVGPTDIEIRAAVRDGLNTTVEKLLQPFGPPVALIQEFAGKEPNTGPPEPEGPRYDAWVWDKLERRTLLIQWWLKAMIDSPLSIQERMVFFWHNHFTSDVGKVEFAEFAFMNNQLLRAYALGNFKEMVKAVGKDPAMLTFLDGEVNTRFSLNENYARELLELFTTGRVDSDGHPNYSQKDVVEAARAFTGWQKQHSTSKGEAYHALESIFWWHLWDDSSKTFLGETGKWNADDIVDILFRKRADQIARFVCTKLYKRFVSLKPDNTVILAMADLFKRSNWEIKPVLQALLRSRHFFDRENIGCLPKDLMEFYIGMIRAMKLQRIPDFAPYTGIVPLRDLYFRLEAYGMLPFHPPNVSGWPTGRAWVSSAALVPRLKFARDVARGTVKPVVHTEWQDPYLFDPLSFVELFPNPHNPRVLINDMALHFLGVQPSKEESKRLFTALMDGGVEHEWNLYDPNQRSELRIRRFLEALFTLPKFQLY